MRKVTIVLLVLIMLLAFTGCSKVNRNAYIVTDGEIPDRVNYYSDVSKIYMGELDVFEKFYYFSDDYIYLIVKANKIESTNYYRDYEDTTHVVNLSADKTTSYTSQNIVFYTLSDFYITDILNCDYNESEYNVGDKVTILEPYAYKPSDDGKREFIIQPGYDWPLMKNDKEYLIFLRMPKDRYIEYGNEDTKEKLIDVWRCFGVFILDDNIIDLIESSQLDNEETYYGPYLELYSPALEKYLDYDININKDISKTPSPRNIYPTPAITPKP